MTATQPHAAIPDKPVPPCPPWCTARAVDAWDWVVVPPSWLALTTA